jgi:two-component system chemotaxis response regulator CheY
MNTALVVDDSRTVRAILRRALTQHHFEVLEAGNGKEALQVVEQQKAISLVLADWHMPEMTGLELVKALRRRRDLWDLRIVMVTTESDSARVAAALAAGADEYVMKPFTTEILMQKLEMIGALRSTSS